MTDGRQAGGGSNPIGDLFLFWELVLFEFKISAADRSNLPPAPDCDELTGRSLRVFLSRRKRREPAVRTHEHFREHGAGSDFTLAGLHDGENVDAGRIEMAWTLMLARIVAPVVAGQRASVGAGSGWQDARMQGNFACRWRDEIRC